MKLPIRTALLDYRRDSYLDSCPEDVGRRNTGELSIPDRIPEGGILDCASGYFSLGASPRVAAALRGFDPARVSRYPEHSHETLLKPAILERFSPRGISPAQLFLGHGSFNLVERVIHKFLQPNGMLGVGPQFTEIPSEYVETGGTYRSLPLDPADGGLPLSGLEQEVAAGAFSVLYLDNPNNPTGRFFPPAEVDRLAAACERRGTVLLVDEAWGDYVDDRESAIHLVAKHRNMIVVRSFSKALGLAGERVGYMFLSAELARFYRQVDVPFEPGIVAASLAREVLGDAAWLARVRSEARSAKARIVEVAERRGLEVLPTHPDVAILSFHSPARSVVSELGRRGIRVLAGSSFAGTHPGWDDRRCRLRVVHGEQLELLCQRLSTL